jgi:uncharacterized membrane protein YagU involved in acid resistance
MPSLLKMGVVAGVLATLVMDVGGTLFRRLGLTSGVPPALFGKWVSDVSRGQLLHDNIATSPGVPSSMLVALLTHYGIGIVLGIGYVTLSAWLAPTRGQLWLAVGYGLATSVFAWFLMYPAMGFGVFGTRGPPEFMLFRTSLINHLFYGLGLATFTLWAGPLLFRSLRR